MHWFNAALSDVLSAEFDAFVWKHASKDISDVQEQSVKGVHYVTGQCLNLRDVFTVTNIQHIITELCKSS